MYVSDVLQLKGHDVVSVAADTPAVDVLRLFQDRQIGLVVVGQTPTHVEGTASERNFCNAVATHGPEALNQPVAAIMERRLITCAADDTLPRVMAIMTQERKRHVLVMDGETLAGVISIGDVVKHRLDEALRTEKELHHYIAGTGYH
ncbi:MULTISPECIES: CBS domain-containing protein [unclassified Ruegeria]|uniref:CBS domain-containing protein n=1 Tax=unclassified Ruegeria TaxID=2625375 RepID=UPI001488B230|nr:CBS domain-containing protein [Ruegeria sp. HKCCD8929]